MSNDERNPRLEEFIAVLEHPSRRIRHEGDRHDARMTDDEVLARGWYAVRCVFRAAENRPLGPTNLGSGTNAYEERITLWRASSFDEAVSKAEVEAQEYAETLGDRYLGFAQGYHLSEDPGDGGEAFSLIRVSDLEPDAYLNRFFDSGAERQQHIE